MALTFSEQQELKQLEAMAASRTPSSGLSASEQQELAQLEALAAPKTSKVEAELGLIDRARYSLEPIQSNREALLRQQFGPENVITDSQGELYVRQQGAFRPVNKPGFGMIDIAEFAGALPEVVPEYLGGLVGGTAGLAVGAPSGPGAVATGALGLAGGRAVGGALGSGFRQALSAATGTPQVATLPERALEVGMSAAAAPIGGAVADFALSRLGKMASRPLLSEASQQPTQQIATQISQQTPRSISEELASLTGSELRRPMVQEEFKRLSKIAQEQGLPAPTLAQAASGRAVLAEGKLLETPLVGSKVRKQVDAQLKAVKDNLESIAGAFLDAESTAFDVGLNTKKLADEALNQTKTIASNLYEQVDQLGANASIGKRPFFNKFRDFAGKYEMINPDMTLAKYSPTSGLSREQFDSIQRIIADNMSAIRQIKSPNVRFESINTLRKSIRNELEGTQDRNSRRILNELYQEINDTTQRALDRESPRLSGVFKEANKTYKKFLDQEEFLVNALPVDKSEDTYVKRVLSNYKDVDKLKEVIGEERVKEIGLSRVADILKQKLEGAGVARASAAIAELRKNKQGLVSAIGEKQFNNLVSNLDYLNRVNQPLIPNRKSLLSLMNDQGVGVKGVALNILSSTKNLAETGRFSPGDVLTRAARSTQNIPTGPVTRSSIGNILSTQQQTEANR